MKSDTQLQQDVLAELQWEPAVNAAHIGVQVSDGIVTLAGHVESYGEKWHAEEATQRVTGVKGLAVDMVVNLSGSAQRTDTDIARSVQHIFEWMTYIPEDGIKVMVENGWITLTGDVEQDYQKRAIESCVSNLIGVTGVSNQIMIQPKVSGQMVKLDIENALKRRAIDDAQKITVTIKDEEVILSGKVHSWSERSLARQSAWGAPGVKNVIDNMSVN